jgi:AAA domain
MHVVFLYGPPASGKHTIGLALSELTGLPLFHNHLAVDTAKSLFAFGTSSFNRMRAIIWRAAFTEAAVAGRGFIFTFNPEATVEPELISDLCASVRAGGGRLYFVELTCSPETVAQRIGDESRTKFGKLTDKKLYAELRAVGAFAFPPLPAALLVIDTEEMSAAIAAEKIARAVAAAENDA